MHIIVETITPALAAAYLERNTGNRPKKERHIAQIADAMKRGQWMLTHEAIAFSKSGRLIDGQHRLCAVVKSNATVQMHVARECEESTFAVIGDGARRKAADVLSTMGESHSVKLAGMIRCALEGMDRGTYVTKSDVRKLIESKHGTIARELVTVPGASSKNWLPSPCAGACLRGVLSGEIPKEKAIDAISRFQLEDWRKYGLDDPMRAMRTMLSREQSTTERYAYAVRAWRAVAADEALKKLYKADTDFAFVFSND